MGIIQNFKKFASKLLNKTAYIEKRIKGTKHKYFCLQVAIWENWTYFDFNLRCDRACDHAGLNLSIQILWFFFTFYTNDNRHWNMDEKRWYTEEDYKKEERRLSKKSKRANG